LIENAMLAIAGVALGILLAIAISGLLGHISVTLDLPWDLSSTPHFIPEATLNRTQPLPC
jgi:ABC-type antimicrobial peptide transport system permease subunit